MSSEYDTDPPRRSGRILPAQDDPVDVHLTREMLRE